MSLSNGGTLAEVSGFLIRTFRSCDDDATECAQEGSVARSHEVLGLIEDVLKRLAAESDASQLSREFVRKCLIYNKLCPSLTVETIVNFLRYRRAAKWPLRIPVDAVRSTLPSGVHALVSRKQSRDLQADYVWAGNSNRSDAGPAACVVMNVAAIASSVCTVEELQKLSMFVMERVTDSIEVQQRGIALIVDFRNVQFSKFASRVSKDDIYRGASLWKGAFPCRLRRAWIIDAPFALRCVLSGVVRLLKPHVRQRICMAHRSMGLQDIRSDLGALFDLPSSFGGDGELDVEKSLAPLLIEPESIHSKDAEASRALGRDTASDASSRTSLPRSDAKVSSLGASVDASTARRRNLISL